MLVFIMSFGLSQNNCELCVEQNGLYCGDDESNWTQYSPLGCVPNGLNELFYLNDGWLDCVDGSDEEEAVPTTLADCEQYVIPCDTIFVTDTLYIDNFITEYIDCDSGLPCPQIGLIEIIKQSQSDGKMYNIKGQQIYRRKGLYIENGVINFKND